MKIWESGRESALLDDIIAGRKTIEGRLNRGKFAEYNVGDRVWLRRDYRDDNGVLQDGEPHQAFVEIVAIRKYKNSLDMVTTEGFKRVMPNAKSAIEAAEGYDTYYSKEDQVKFGVLAIELKLIPKTKWDEWYDEGIDYTQMKDTMVARIATLAADRPGKKALDIGCGTGRLTRQLKDNGFSVTGVDPAQQAIAKATTLDNEIEYRVGGIEAVEGEKFDLVTCKLVYKFINDKVDFLHRVNECLLPGGCFILITPTLDRVISGKPAICVDRATLIDEVEQFFVIKSQQELPVGLMLVLESK